MLTSGPEEICAVGGGGCLFLVCFRSTEVRKLHSCVLAALVHLVLVGEDLETHLPWAGCAGAGEELLPASPVGL